MIKTNLTRRYFCGRFSGYGLLLAMNFDGNVMTPSHFLLAFVHSRHRGNFFPEIIKVNLYVLKISGNEVLRVVKTVKKHAI